MSNNLMQLTDTLAEKLGLASGEGLIDTMKNTAFKDSNATNDQLTALLVVANQYSLNPWTREIYAFPDKGGIVPIVGVDGWSRIINSHPQFDGIDFEQDDEKCTAIIYRKDRSHPIKVTEYMNECCRSNAQPWKTHPKRMLRHKAMIQCARIAFGFSGIYDPDEGERIIENTATEVNVGKQSHDKRPELIAKCEQVAMQGLDKFGEYWASLPVEDKKIIGNEEKERIKGLCPVEAEFSEVDKSTGEIINDDPF